VRIVQYRRRGTSGCGVEQDGSIFAIVTLEPGDCLMTGTPAGCGTFMQPPRFLKPGDAVTVSASGIGELTNPVEAGTARTH
jgi:2-keto-4-pentenoate hydratase/2-oxohepta-3-ene-1,7-dioic acid hydratase in catechol pathway